jgi:hypothetical protein
MTRVAVSELESALERWIGSTQAATKGPWNRHDGFWLVSDPRQVHFRLCIDAAIEIELLQGRACKAAPVSSVHQALQLIDLFLKQRGGLETLPGTGWKTSWQGSAVPATIIDHPERITIEQIDSEPDDVLRTAMIDQYGVDRYWHDTKRNPTGFIHDSRHIANVIENWRTSTGADVAVVREVLCEDDPRNYEEVVVVRLGAREVLFGEPHAWRSGRVFVSVTEGDVRKAGYLSRREEAERLLEAFLRQHCGLEGLPPLGSEIACD